MRISFAKFSLIALMLCVAANCNAEVASVKPGLDNCKYTRANMPVKIPADSNIVSSYWQKSTELVGFVDRFHLVFADGSSAVIQHSYCATYNFSIIYYAKKIADINNEKKATAIIERLFAYNAYDLKKISFKKPLGQIIESALKEKGYTGRKELIAPISDDNFSVNDALYLAVFYYPLNDAGVSEGVLDLDFSIGGTAE